MDGVAVGNKVGMREVGQTDGEDVGRIDEEDDVGTELTVVVGIALGEFEGTDEGFNEGCAVGTQLGEIDDTVEGFNDVNADGKYDVGKFVVGTDVGNTDCFDDGILDGYNDAIEVGLEVGFVEGDREVGSWEENEVGSEEGRPVGKTDDGEIVGDKEEGACDEGSDEGTNDEGTKEGADDDLAEGENEVGTNVEIVDGTVVSTFDGEAENNADGALVGRLVGEHEDGKDEGLAEVVKVGWKEIKLDGILLGTIEGENEIGDTVGSGDGTENG